MQKKHLIVALAFIAALAACVSQEPTEERRYDVKGKIVSVDAENEMVTLDHEAIPGFMAAMTMPYQLKDKWAFDYLEPGDRLNAVLVVRGDEYWLENAVISEAPVAVDEDAVPPSRIGEPLPSVELTNQDGQTIRTDHYAGKALLITFIYTRCPLSEFCPRMTAQFGALERMLKNEPSLYEKTHLLTISFDPAHDTPEKLRQYALDEGHITADTFAHWEFATGAPESIHELAEFLDLEYSMTEDEDQTMVHNLRTAVVAPDGTLYELHTGNTWQPNELLDALHAMPLGTSSPPES
jgi:protein SCO1/2